mmetsp:Transcript_25760/g.40343  ORF Transcript_25760/g.40343 Transcript_25760/m.40343 type:complete len:95 (+) Transcript_25760:475-759(+)
MLVGRQEPENEARALRALASACGRRAQELEAKGLRGGGLPGRPEVLQVVESFLEEERRGLSKVKALVLKQAEALAPKGKRKPKKAKGKGFGAKG